MPSRVELANALRALAIDAIEKSKSGHPGAPLGMAQMGEVLWRDFLKHNPSNPQWYNRDRFILSNGHASMLLYGLLHLTGYAVSMEDIRNFRQFGSATPGHPEHGRTPGVEISTGPLGQGLASAVGFAMAERMLAETFNKPNFPVVDHFTYVFVGDGCLMEGVSQEAISLAGTLGLNKLIVDSLKHAGYTNLIHTENGKQAYDVIQACKNDKTLDKHVQCVITDIEMPVMDGHRLTKLIKDDSETAHIPVIIFSSLVNDEMKKKGESLGANAQLSKPEIGNLVHVIDDLVGR